MASENNMKGIKESFLDNGLTKDISDKCDVLDCSCNELSALGSKEVISCAKELVTVFFKEHIARTS